MLSGCVTIIDPIALILIQRFGGEFGRERLFSSFGMALFSPLTGVLIDIFSYSGTIKLFSADLIDPLKRSTLNFPFFISRLHGL